jgi:ABC-2 type transport system permease protein
VKSNILPLYLKELRSLFFSPVAYIVLTGFVGLTGLFWAMGVTQFAQYSMMYAGRPGMELDIARLLGGMFGNTAVILLFVAPMIGMRSFSEERRAGTIETLFTLPFTDLDIVLAKWLAAMTLLLLMLVPMFLHMVMIAGKTIFPWSVVATGFLGLLLFGSAILSLANLVSSLTENQVVAGVVTFGIGLGIWVLSWIAGEAPYAVRSLLEQVSPLNHLNDLHRGVVNLQDLSYFILFTAFMLFGTLRVLESKKWR